MIEGRKESKVCIGETKTENNQWKIGAWSKFSMFVGIELLEIFGFKLETEGRETRNLPLSSRI